jgi:hypothetical protein
MGVRKGRGGIWARKEQGRFQSAKVFQSQLATFSSVILSFTVIEIIETMERALNVLDASWPCTFWPVGVTTDFIICK